MQNHILYSTSLIALEISEKEGVAVDTIFCLPWICVLDSKNSKKYNLFSIGPRKHLDWIEALEVPFQVKLTKMPLVNFRLTEIQSRSKSSQNNIFYIRPLERVGTSAIVNIIKFSFQGLFMGRNRS